MEKKSSQRDKKKEEFLPSLEVSESLNVLFWIKICWLLACINLICLVGFHISVVLPQESAEPALVAIFASTSTSLEFKDLL